MSIVVLKTYFGGKIMKKGLKIASLVMAMSLALSCGIAVSAEEAVQEAPVPKNSKTVKANGDGTYDIALSFEGKISTERSINSADVVLIADRSGSMNSNTISSDPNIKTSWDSLKNAVNILSDKILMDDKENNMSVVVFDNEAEGIKFNDSYWTNSLDEFKDTFNNVLDPVWGNKTHSDKGFEKAIEVLATANDNSKKYVVFLSDGYPEAYGVSNSEMRKLTLEQVEKLKTAYPDAVVYSIGIPDCDEDFMKEVSANDDNYFYAEDSDELAKVFDSIADVITKAYSNVVISDSLSEYAEYVNYDENGKPIFDVEIRDANGDIVDNAAYDLTYNEETKTVSLNLGTEQIPDKWTYKLSYKVKPNAYADEFFAKNGYDAVGDANTDADGNATSSGKDGFKISDGKIEFTYRDTDYSSKFASPVFQVEEKAKPSEPESSKVEPSKPEPSKSEGKPANNVPQTGSAQNTTFMLAVLAASAAVVISAKALKAKKSK